MLEKLSRLREDVLEKLNNVGNLEELKLPLKKELNSVKLQMN